MDNNEFEQYKTNQMHAFDNIASRTMKNINTTTDNMMVLSKVLFHTQHAQTITAKHISDKSLKKRLINQQIILAVDTALHADCPIEGFE